MYVTPKVKSYIEYFGGAARLDYFGTSAKVLRCLRNLCRRNRHRTLLYSVHHTDIFQKTAVSFGKMSSRRRPCTMPQKNIAKA